MREKAIEQLGKTLLDAEMLSVQQWENVLKQVDTEGLDVTEALLKLRYLSEEEIEEVLEIYYGVPFARLSEYILEGNALRKIPEHTCRMLNLIPLSIDENNILTVAMADPKDVPAIDNLKLMTKMDIGVVLSTKKDILRAIEMYHTASSSVDDGDHHSILAGAVKPEDLKLLHSISEETPIIQLVNEIFSKAIDFLASDIHIEPTRTDLMVRFRIDGVLRVFLSVPLALHRAVVSRIKIIADMNITEKRLPQDGRAEIGVRGRLIDLRISTVPLIYGEKVVIRILDKTIALLTLEKLGYNDHNQNRLKTILGLGCGMLLLTGPTGSGKTSTTYSIINQLKSIEKNIVTVENPVEYQLDLVNQMQIQHKIGLDYALCLRSILRQDPDIIVLGEIRDYETADIAIHAALTGHMVLSTLHTNDSTGAITRLLDMGVANYLITSSVIGVISQRLLRKLCPLCRRKYTPEAGEWEAAFGLEHLKPDAVYKAVGCSKCNRTGYKGRTAIAEVLLISNNIKKAIMGKVDTVVINSIAKQEGLTTLIEDAMVKVLQGNTSLEEVVKASI